MTARQLSVYAYQELLDRGWRRSGSYVYRPVAVQSCCPAYAIRLDTDLFEPSRTQRRVLQRFEQFLCGARSCLWLALRLPPPHPFTPSKRVGRR